MPLARLLLFFAVTGMIAVAAGFSATSAQSPAPLQEPGIVAEPRP